MIWKDIMDWRVGSAYEFMNNIESDYARFILNELEDGLFNYYEKVDELTEDYGSDYDLIHEVIAHDYPTDKYFYLVDFIEDLRCCEDYFRIRVWELVKE